MGVFKELLKGVKDLELRVKTFTGELTAVVKEGEGGDKVLNWEKLIANAKTVEGTIKLVAETTVKIGGEANQHISPSATDEMRQSHATAVETGRKVREGLVSMFKNLVGAN